jgi:hypothetical protein
LLIEDVILKSGNIELTLDKCDNVLEEGDYDNILQENGYMDYAYCLVVNNYTLGGNFVSDSYKRVKLEVLR